MRLKGWNSLYLSIDRFHLRSSDNKMHLGDAPAAGSHRGCCRLQVNRRLKTTPFTVSFGKNRHMLLTSLPRCVIALEWSLYGCPSVPVQLSLCNPKSSPGRPLERRCCERLPTLPSRFRRRDETFEPWKKPIPGGSGGRQRAQLLSDGRAVIKACHESQ